MSAGSLPKCYMFITLSASVISLSVVKIGRWVWELLINVLKSPIPQWWGKWQTKPDSVSRIGSPPKVNQLFRLVGPIMTSSFSEIGWFLFRSTEWQTDEWDKPTRSQNLCLSGGDKQQYIRRQLTSVISWVTADTLSVLWASSSFAFASRFLFSATSSSFHALYALTRSWNTSCVWRCHYSQVTPKFYSLQWNEIKLRPKTVQLKSTNM